MMGYSSILLAVAWAHRVDVFHRHSSSGAQQALSKGRFRNLGERAMLRVVGEWSADLDLVLSRDVFASTYKELAMVNGSLHVMREGRPNCHYVGSVTVGNRSGVARASTCTGALQAVAMLDGTMVELTWTGDTHEVRDVDTIPAFRGGDPVAPAERGARERRLQSGGDCGPDDDSTKWISIVAFNDAARYARRGMDVEEQTSLIFALVRDLYEGLRGYSLGCDVRPRLVGQITWRDANPDAVDYVFGNGCSNCDCGSGDNTADVCTSDAEFSSCCLLRSFGDFTESARSEIEATLGTSMDNAQLLTGVDLNENTWGLGYVEGLCSTSGFSSALSSTFHLETAIRTAALVAHELGHNLGMRHDSASVENEYIMAAFSTGSGEESTIRFSNESRAWVASWFANDYSSMSNQCLDDAPPFDDDEAWDRDDELTSCGDGIVDVGEQCDVGVGVVDECCLSDCSLADGCECASSADCCVAGQIAAAGLECRSGSHDACDFAEVCDGVSEECPVDLFASPGTACVSDVTGDNGACYRGQCVAAADNCADFVLNDGTVAPFLCDSISSCTAFFCSDSSGPVATCYTFSDPMLDGSPCGNGFQCEVVSFGDSADLDAPVSQCVTSASIKNYHWFVTDNCVEQCRDETGTPVDDSLCEDDPPALPGRCSFAPSISPAPTSTPIPTGAPSLVPTPAPSVTPKPSQPPNADDDDSSSNGLFRGFTRLTFGARVVVIFAVILVLACLCLLCGCCRRPATSALPKHAAPRNNRVAPPNNQPQDTSSIELGQHPPGHRRPRATAPTSTIYVESPRAEDNDIQLAMALSASMQDQHRNDRTKAAPPAYPPPTAPLSYDL